MSITRVIVTTIIGLIALASVVYAIYRATRTDKEVDSDPYKDDPDL